jgi:hypothetical protein
VGGPCFLGSPELAREAFGAFLTSEAWIFGGNSVKRPTLEEAPGEAKTVRNKKEESIMRPAKGVGSGEL